MKKTILIAILVLGTAIASAQQNNSSIFFGYTNVETKLKMTAQGESESESVKAPGFFIGVTEEIPINEITSFKPSFIYTNFEFENAGEKTSAIQVPLFIKYRVSERFALLGGPKLDYLLNTTGSDDDYINDLSIALGLGLEMALNDKIYLIANYSIQLSNTLTKQAQEEISDDLNVNIDITQKQNYLNLGLAYKF